MTEYEYRERQRLKKLHKKRQLILISSELLVVLILLIWFIVRVANRGEASQPEINEEVKEEVVPDNNISGKEADLSKAGEQLSEQEILKAVYSFAGSFGDGSIAIALEEKLKTEAQASGDTNQTQDGHSQSGANDNKPQETEDTTGETSEDSETEGSGNENATEQVESEVLTKLMAEADIAAQMYDYDKAIELVKSYEGYESSEAATTAIAGFEEKKGELVLWPDNTQISHLFVHSLIVDTSRAFGKGSSQPKGYNQYMTTVGEFNQMMEQMYEKGYVLISIHDIAKRVIDEDGTEKLVKNDIWLPEGKIPFVLSQDDVNYYLYMENDGFADRLVIGEDGIPTCQYTDIDGTVKYGEYDMLPIIDRFVKEHPDFSYHGAKGILAVTGYEGALGYDTGLSMKMYDSMTEEEKMACIEAEREKAKAVADAIKADGWEFASHSYTHSNMTNATVDKLNYDTTRWHNEVEPILGPTDIYIYPYGADICDWRGYKGDKFELLKAAGFWYYCNVDAARYWIQIRDQYFRMGRINADGERMYKTPEKLQYFFDVNSLYDKSRPAF